LEARDRRITSLRTARATQGDPAQKTPTKPKTNKKINKELIRSVGVKELNK
jgi:hypothetical protein